MQSRLRKGVERTSRKREEFLSTLSGLPAAALEWRPGEGAWTLLEIVEHLVLAEQNVLVDLSDLKGLEVRSRSWLNVVRYWLVLGVLRFKIPVPVPSEGMVPKGGRPLSELADLWERQHAALLTFVSELAPTAESSPIFVHPVTGPLTVTEAVRMLEVHLDRHIGQARKTMGLWASR